MFINETNQSDQQHGPNNNDGNRPELTLHVFLHRRYDRPRKRGCRKRIPPGTSYTSGSHSERMSSHGRPPRNCSKRILPGCAKAGSSPRRRAYESLIISKERSQSTKDCASDSTALLMALSSSASSQRPNSLDVHAVQMTAYTWA